MALKMAQPWKDPASGIYHLRQRTPRDLAGRTKGTKARFTINDEVVVVTIGSTVQVSLRTRDPAIAKERHAAADAELRRHWAALRNGVTELTHRDAVALAGWVYRAAVGVFENEPEFSRKFIALEEARRKLLAKGGNADPLALEAALHETMLEEGIDLRAIADNREISTLEAMETMFGGLADKLLSGKGIVVDADSRRMLLEEVRRAYRLFVERTRRAFDGDYGSDKEANRFPAWSRQINGANPRAVVTMSSLIDRWNEKQATARAPATLDRYAPSLQSFANFVGTREVSSITSDEIYRWAEKRRDVDGVSAKTVNNNDLVALNSVLNWATRHPGGRVLENNPARGIQLELPRGAPAREKTFRPEEISRILQAANRATVRTSDPKLLVAKRWCPWLAAYTGARISECTSIRREDVRKEGEVWLVGLERTKGNKPRRVPLHEHLIELGFIDFVDASEPGPLFHDAQQPGVKTHPADLRSEYLARWVREEAGLDDYGVSPNHGWRHTFKTRLLAVGVLERVSDAITGHSSRGVARAYESPTIGMMAEAIAKLPRYFLSCENSDSKQSASGAGNDEI